MVAGDIDACYHGYLTYPTNQEELQEVQENRALPWVFPTALVIEREAILEIGGC
jgi:hypothetical protein